MAKKLEGITVSIGADLRPLSDALKGVNKEITGTQSQLREVEKLLKFNPNNVELLTQKQDLLNDKVVETAAKLKTLKNAEAEVQKQFEDGNIKKEQYEEFRRELIKTESQLKAAEKATRELNPTLEVLGNKFNSAGKSIESAGKAILPVSAAVAGLKAVAVNTASEFQSAFAGVRKTVDATEEQFAELEKGIRNMAKEMPQSASAIASVAEAAGQLGIKTENILDFTKTMIMLGDATNLSSEEAASSFAKFANIVGMSQDNFDKLGSATVALGNNLATTEADIVSMAMRLAGAGKQIKLTEAEIFGFAGALSSVGIEAEAGGSAFSKVMIEMQLAVETQGLALKEFASVSGMTSKEFTKAFKDDASGAIMAFIEGLGKAEEKGQSTIAVLEDMGIKEVRLRDALLRASSASDVFSNAIEISSTAWTENTALVNEAEQRYATFESQMSILKNVIADIGISFGEIMLPSILKVTESVKSLLEKVNELNPAAKTIVVVIGSIIAVAGPFLIILGQMTSGFGLLIKAIPKVTAAFSFLSVAKLKDMAETIALNALYAKDAIAKGASVVATGAMTAATTAYNIVVGIATTVTTALGAAIAFLTSPLGLVIVAITALVAGIIYLWKTNEDFRKFVIVAWEAIKKTVANVVNGMVKFFTETIPQAIQTLIKGFNDMVDKIKDAWNLVIDFFVTTVPEMIQKVLEWFDKLPYNIGFALGYAYTTVVQFGVDLINWVKAEIPKFIKGIITYISSLPSQFMEWLNNVIDVVANWGNDMVISMTSFIAEMFENVSAFLSSLPDMFMEWLSNVIDAIAEWGSNVIDTVAKTMESLITSFIDYLSSLPGLWKEWFDAVVKYLEDMKTTMLSKGKDLMIGLWDGIKAIWTNVSTWFINTVTGIADFFKGLPQTLYDIGANAMNSLWDGLKSIWNNVKGWFDGVLSKIGQFGKGIEDGKKAAEKKVDGSHAGGLAYVPFDGYVAELHRGERVLTANENKRLNETVSASNETTVIQNIYAQTPSALEQQRAAMREFRKLAWEG